jgi:hypothetical protein
MSSDSGERIIELSQRVVELAAENERLKNEIDWLRSVIENMLDKSDRK